MATTAPTAGGPGGTAQLDPSQIPTSGPVTPLEIYELLLAKGYSTAQAVGIMANAINESGLDPESQGSDPTDTNPNARAYGLLQWNTGTYPNAGALVTGNPQADIRAQIAYLGQTVGQSALQGADGATVAGNFAANFERCKECQPGGAQYAGRVANAAKVMSWVTSGAWPQSAGGAGGGGGGSSSSTGCLIQLPSLLGVGGGCVFTTSAARALVGGSLLAIAVPVGLVGSIVLAAFGFRSTGAGQHVGRAAEAVGGAVALVPGGQAAGAAVAAAGSAEARAGRRARQERAGREQAARDRHEARQYDEVMSRTRDSARGPAIRDDEPVPF